MRCLITARDGPGPFVGSAAKLSEGTANNSDLATVWVDPSRRFQTIEGFGAAFTEAAAVTWQQLGQEQRAGLLRDYFDPVHGHGYTLCRVHMNSCDFALGNYAHVQTPGDVELYSFSVERDHQALLPFIQAALQVAGRPIKLLASPSSPPAWMKSNFQMNQGGKLLPQFRQAWARCYVRFMCSAPILADRTRGALLHQSSYWYIGHFARFIEPGARRVLCATNKQAVDACVFVKPDG